MQKGCVVTLGHPPQAGHVPHLRVPLQRFPPACAPPLEGHLQDSKAIDQKDDDVAIMGIYAAYSSCLWSPSIGAPAEQPCQWCN
eukprot:1158314-Pelagomonas_calceolata.AAC.9